VTDNLAIWNAVSKTDPKHTKRVSQRGGFTAINANSQIMAATKQFGPIGIGWGYTAGDPIFHDTLVIVPVTMWHGDRSNEFGPVFGCEEWKDNKGRVDSDAPKKAGTDGLTKLLSQLGFNADVFLGLYDDQKYVAQVTREFAEADREPLPTGPINDKTRDWLAAQIDATSVPVGEFCNAFDATSLKAITYEQMDAVQQWLRKNKKAA
jgi:hypothetical protein